MARIDSLNNLPEINILEDEGISIESIINDMIADYESKWEELTGEALTLYPGDSRRLMIDVLAGKLYQLAAVINERYKLNFVQYMYGDFLKNWAANFGYKENGLEAATVTLRFHLSEVQPDDVTIPSGTRATNGNRIFFATDENLIIPAGQLHADVNATCTVMGVVGNDYIEGQINEIADPVNFVERVENIEVSSGGHDEYTDLELRELIYNFPSAYSTAGPAECYEEITKAYSGNIIDAKAITSSDAVVQISVMLLNGKSPEKSYCDAIKAYFEELKTTPDTDKIEILAPERVDYRIEATFYISSEQKSIESALKDTVEDAVSEFVEYTQSKIGRAITPDTLIAYAKASGASRIAIIEPAYTAINRNQIAICSEVKLTYGGLETE